MKIFPIMTGFLLMGLAAAEAADPIDVCRPSLSRDEFESRGGKLVMTRSPNMQFPKDISEICRGATGMGIIVLRDGSIRVDGFDHNHFGTLNDPLDMTGRTTAKCDALIERRVREIRFSPPHLAGTPVCVGFNVDWSSSSPSELIPFGKFPR